MKNLIIILLISILFFSCNTDGNSNEGPETKPVIQYIYPTDGSTDIPVNHKIIFKFNTTIDNESFKENVSIKYFDNDDVSYNVSYDNIEQTIKEDSHIIAIIPDEYFIKATRYNIAISKGLQSSKGIMLGNDENCSFMTNSEGSGKDIATPDYDRNEISKEVIKIFFKEHLYPLQINEKTVNLKIEFDPDPNGIDRTVDYDFENQCILIFPDELLLDGKNYEITYDGDIEDLAGNLIGGDRTIFFSFEIVK